MVEKLSFINPAFWHYQDWDKPENIPDPDAKKPEDWDEDMDGEWEPAMIPNPEYKVQIHMLQKVKINYTCSLISDCDRIIVL